MTPIVRGRVSHLVVGRKTRQAFYIQNNVVFATNVDTGATRKILEHPRLRTGSGFGLSADETTLAGSFVTGDATGTQPPGSTRPPATPPPANPLATPPPTRSSLETRWAARLPMALYTLNVNSGELKTIHQSTDWLNHVQMSPTDPTLHHVLPRRAVALRRSHLDDQDERNASGCCCTSGRWRWRSRATSSSAPTARRSGTTCRRRGARCSGLPASNVVSGKPTRYPVAREEWSVHFNISPDGKLFAGDGGGPRSVAAPGNGQWIYLFRPTADGKLAAERLVDLSKHDYQLEPNVTFTPDQQVDHVPLEHARRHARVCGGSGTSSIVQRFRGTAPGVQRMGTRTVSHEPETR